MKKNILSINLQKCKGVEEHDVQCKMEGFKYEILLAFEELIRYMMNAGFEKREILASVLCAFEEEEDQ